MQSRAPRSGHPEKPSASKTHSRTHAPGNARAQHRSALIHHLYMRQSMTFSAHGLLRTAHEPRAPLRTAQCTWLTAAGAPPSTTITCPKRLTFYVRTDVRTYVRPSHCATPVFHEIRHFPAYANAVPLTVDEWMRLPSW